MTLASKANQSGAAMCRFARSALRCGRAASQYRRCVASLATGPGGEAAAQRRRLLQSCSQGERRWLDRYLDRLLDAQFNLTAIKSREEAIERHVEDSLALLPAVERCAQQASSSSSSLGAPGEGGKVKLIDVGSGAGMPGLVLALKHDNWDVTLLDSLRKRCDFLSAASEDLDNVSVRWGRAEDVGRDEAHRGRHHVATARAVAEMRVLAELCLPLVSVGGFLVAAKGPEPDQEVEAAMPALEKLNAELVGIEPVQSFGDHGQRTVVIVRKRGETPNRYPRQAGTPKRKPL